MYQFRNRLAVIDIARCQQDIQDFTAIVDDPVQLEAKESAGRSLAPLRQTGIDLIGSNTLSETDFQNMIYAIKAEVNVPGAETFAFSAQKTMYGGKRIAQGDTIYIFASENEGGSGLIAKGVVTSAKAIAKKPGIARQTPLVSITVKCTALAKRSLERNELNKFFDWNDGRPETELNFKFYRQATNKIVGISEVTAVFLGGYFKRVRI